MRSIMIGQISWKMVFAKVVIYETYSGAAGY